jgi:hypothetical protein
MRPPSVLIKIMSANAADSTYQQQLPEQNDRNWERFRTELHTAIAKSEARVTVKVSDKHFDLMKSIFFVYWFVTMLMLGGLIVVLSRK